MDPGDEDGRVGLRYPVGVEWRHEVHLEVVAVDPHGAS